MRGVRRTTPLFITCQRPGCGQIREVQRPSAQRKQKYCTKRCANLVNVNIMVNHRVGVERSVIMRKRRLLARVAGLDPLAAFNVGYRCGLESKCRQLRKHYVFVKRATA